MSPTSSTPDQAPSPRRTSGSSAQVSQEHAAWLMTSAAKASVAVAAVLILAKLLAWALSDSVSVLASLADSLMDAVASMLNYFAVRYSLQPADDDHRFGHGKAEFLAGLAQSVFIFVSAVFLLVQGIGRLVDPHPLEAYGIGIGVMVFSMIATTGLLMWQRHVVRKTHSVAIHADAMHYLSDLTTNGGVIVALIAAHAGFPWLDPLFAIILAVYVGHSAYRIGKAAAGHLLDQELGDDVHECIETIVRQHPEIRDMHNLRTRQSGHIKVIQMHVGMDGDMSLREAHAVVEEIELALEAAFPGADVIIHQDPV